MLNLGLGYLPDFILREVAKPPTAGQGVHDFLYWLALKLHAWRTDPEIEAILYEYAESCGRYVPPKEIEDAIRNSAPFAWRSHSNKGTHNSTTGTQQQGSTQVPPRTSPWPSVEPEIIVDICRDGPSLSELRETSPWPCNPSSPTAEEAIELLFPGGPWLCCGRSVQVFATRRREDWHGLLDKESLIVPSAMSGPYGFTTDGRVSAHAKSNVGPRQFLVVECDFAERSRNGLHDTALAPLIRELDKDGISVSDMCAAVLSFVGSPRWPWLSTAAPNHCTPGSAVQISTKQSCANFSLNAAASALIPECGSKASSHECPEAPVTRKPPGNRRAVKRSFTSTQEHSPHDSGSCCFQRSLLCRATRSTQTRLLVHT